MNIIDHFSPNAHARQSSVDTIVLHYTDMLSTAEALRLLCDSEKKVSAHYLIDKSGDIYRLVPEDQVAYHAGISHWRGRDSLNETSIGIEIDNKGHQFGVEVFPNAQIKALLALIDGIRARHNIPDSRIVAHSDIAPDRKKDPGELFPWDHLHRKGHGLWAKIPPALYQLESYGILGADRVKLAQTHLKKIGYLVPISGFIDAQTACVITAFQRRFLPLHITGNLDNPTEQRIQQISQLY